MIVLVNLQFLFEIQHDRNIVRPREPLLRSIIGRRVVDKGIESDEQHLRRSSSSTWLLSGPCRLLYIPVDDPITGRSHLTCN